MNETFAPVHEEALLIPWRLTGRLSDVEAARLDAHLAECADCREDLAQERALLRALSRDADVEPGAQASLQTLWARIDGASESRAPTVRAPHSRPRPSVRSWLLAASVLLSFGAGLGAAALWRVGTAMTAGKFSTAASTAAPAAAAVNLRVVFDDSLTVEQLSELLDRLELVVVDGPGVSGIFTLAPAPGRKVDVPGTLEQLRADPRVHFAEPTGVPGPQSGADQ